MSALEAFDGGHHRFNLRVVDIDTDTALQSRYQWRVPVLLHQDQELCAGQLTDDARRRIEQALS